MTDPFGNDPNVSTNGLIDDPLGGHDRLYFLDPSGHVFEPTERLLAGQVAKHRPSR